MGINRAVVLMLIFLCASNAYPYQGSSDDKANQSVKPLTMRFDFFFKHIQNMDVVADGMDKRHEDSGQWRSHDKQNIGFSDKDWEILHNTALTYRRAIETNDLAIEKMLSLKPPGSPPSDETRTAVRALMHERIKITESAINDLHSKLGDQSFNALVVYLDNLLNKMIVIPASTTPFTAPVPPKSDSRGAGQQ